MQNPDTQLFKEKIFILKDELFRFAKRFLQSEDEAADAVQEQMLKFWQIRDELYKKENLRAFLLKCLRNDCLNRLKHHEMKLNFQKNNTQAEHYTNGYDNMQEILKKMMDSLPEKQRMVMHLKDVEEFDNQEIAEILNMAEAAVRVNLMRARQKMRDAVNRLNAQENAALKTF